MNTKLFSKITVASIITASIILTGCGDKKTSEAQIVEVKPEIVKETKTMPVLEKKKDEVKAKVEEKIKEVKKEETKVIYTNNEAIVHDVFKDVAKIAPEGKQMIMVFGANTDPYSDRLKADITNSSDLQKRLKTEFSSYYFQSHENLRHKQYHEGELMDVDTKTMIMVYGVEATPTIIFSDENAKAVLVVPGYIPTKQFLVTMDFMAQGKWKGKDRKNGEVYQALRDFYIANGIEVIKKKAE